LLGDFDLWVFPLVLAICLDFAEKMLLEVSPWCSWGRVKVAFLLP
jgi:hypothetical protein